MMKDKRINDLEAGSAKLNNAFLLQLFISAKFRVYRHSVLIIILFIAFYYGKDPFIEPYNFYSKFVLVSILLTLLYINMYLLMPRLLFKDRYTAYFLWILVLFFIVCILFFLLKIYDHQYLKISYSHGDDEPSLSAFSLIFFIFMAASAAIKLFHQWIINTNRINELETITAQSELEQLKNQITPHFLFNMLNNANVLIETNPEKASDVLMKLSDQLRYQLYDSTWNKVLLTGDIRFLEDFLDLEKVRRDNFEVIVSKEGQLKGIQIAPLLFICFVENAVKHNMDTEKPSYIKISFQVLNNELLFSCINSKPKIKSIPLSTGGLGLVNIKRRLELIYPGKHTLVIKDTDDSFSVNLNIKL